VHDNTPGLAPDPVGTVVKGIDAPQPGTCSPGKTGPNLLQGGRAIKKLQSLALAGFTCSRNGDVATVLAGPPQPHEQDDQQQQGKRCHDPVAVLLASVSDLFMPGSLAIRQTALQ